MLNTKQEQFCQQYLVDHNASASAVRAGYSKKNARVIAAQLMAKPCIKARIGELKNERSERLGITQNNILAAFWDIANADIKNYMSFKPRKIIITDPATGLQTEKQEGVVVTFKDSDTIDTRNISEISVGKDGQCRIKLHQRVTALTQLARHINISATRADVTNDDEKYSDIITPIEIIEPHEYNSYNNE